MDLKTYVIAKAAGQVAVAKLNDSYVLSIKKFSGVDGSALPPDVQAVDEALIGKALRQAARISVSRRASLSRLEALQCAPKGDTAGKVYFRLCRIQ